MEVKDRKHYCRFQKEKGGTRMEQSELLIKVNQLTGKDYTHKSFLETIAELVQLVEQYQLQETFLLESLKKQTLQIKDMKEKCRFKFVEKVMDENLALAQELALIKGEMSG
jgi:cell division FtsZ-interacting protein ZapD